MSSGTTVNDALVSGLNDPRSLIYDGNGNLYVANFGNGKIGKYTTSGETVNASLISGLNNPAALALDGNGHLYVASFGSGTVGAYTIAGATVIPALITLPGKIDGLAVVPVPPAPKLNIVQAEATFVLIWPTNQIGYALQASPSLQPPAWTTVSNSVVAVGTNNTVTVAATPGATLFRLQK
jgi:hypothetical protein